MKIGRVLAVLLALVLCVSCAAAEGETASNLLSVSGSTVTITLDENPTTGYVWTCALEREGVFKIASDTYTAPDTKLVGAGGQHVWTFEAVAEGDVTALFTLARSGDEKPQETVFVTMRADALLNAEFVCSGRIAGPSVILAFAENPTTGYEWTHEESAQGIVSDLENSGVELDDAAEAVCGAGGVHYWSFNGEAEGDVTIVCTYSRFWEAESDDALTVTHHYHVDADLNVTFLGDDNVVVDAISTTAEAPAVLLSFEEDELLVVKGKTASATISIAPDEASAAGVTYATSDETIATVDAKGKVKGISNGACELIVKSVSDPTVEGRLPIHVVLPTAKLHLEAAQQTVNVGETLATTLSAEPAGETLLKATYRSSNTKIAKVDEDGLVTAIKAGKVTITAYATDGTKKKASVQIKVLQPVEGVTYKYTGVRVGIKSHGTFTMNILPKNASNKHMTWTSSDPSIATAQGTTNKVKISGHAWGRCKIVGTTEDGGYTITLDANIGALNRAVSINSFSVNNKGLPVYSFKNGSPLTITAIHFAIVGEDIQGDPIQLAKNDYTLKGSCYETIGLKQHTSKGRFTLRSFLTFSGVSHYSLAVTGWKCEEGYYDNYGNLKYEYSIPRGSWIWRDAYNGNLM